MGELEVVRRRYAQSVKTVFLSILFASVAGAGEVLDWPADTSKEWQTVSVDKLPAGVQPQDPESPERPLTTVRIRKPDVDGDGIPDLIIDTGRGGSGGSYVIIYRGDGKHYRKILNEQGGIVVCPRERGVARIECWGRVGGGEYRRTVYRFRGGRFIEEFMQTLRHRSEDDKLEVTDTKTFDAK